MEQAQSARGDHTLDVANIRSRATEVRRVLPVGILKGILNGNVNTSMVRGTPSGAASAVDRADVDASTQAIA